MKDHNYWIEALKLEKHPEGGFASLTYESPLRITNRDIECTFEGTRPLSTSIYFLIHDKNISNFHKLQADEIWYYHTGKSLTIAIISTEGDFSEFKLGPNVKNGEHLQLMVPAGSIFGAYIDDEQGYSLVGCMVSFGFDFRDFKLFKRADLLRDYPRYRDIIIKLTPDTE